MSGGKVNFDELLKLPNCAKCSKPIVGQMMKAFEKTFHDTCFVCVKCNGSLAQGYQVEEGKTDPHCTDCFAKTFMPKCKSCGVNINEKSYVQACGGAWHEKCFACTKCKQSLASGEKHWPLDDKPFCQKCFYEVRNFKQPKAGTSGKAPAPKVAVKGK